MIQFDGVTKRYAGGREALRAISLDVAAGELAFLTGHSGAGKTTILKLIALIERPTRGQVLVDGRNVGRLPQRAVPGYRRQIGMVFQDHKLLGDRSVFDNVSLPLIITGLGKREIDRRVRAALDQVNLLGKEKSTPRMLSTGEQQRVGIARAVVARPQLLIADEPTGTLDPERSREIMHLFRRFNEVGVTMLIATHDLALLDQLGGRRVVLRDGEVQ
jgi:cell division transport system ATP-binding protein